MPGLLGQHLTDLLFHPFLGPSILMFFWQHDVALLSGSAVDQDSTDFMLV